MFTIVAGEAGQGGSSPVRLLCTVTAAQGAGEDGAEIRERFTPSEYD